MPESKPRPPGPLQEPPSLLGGMSIHQFLHRHWQKKPLLIRQAIPDFQSFLSPGTMMRLAGEDGVQPRRVPGEDGEHPWQVRNGPFTPVEFRRLPRTHWTLLVQDVDKLRSEAADLLEHFNFIAR